MMCRYEFTLDCICPVDGSCDHYDAVIESGAEVRVERILEVVAAVSGLSATQEFVTLQIAKGHPNCRVTTVGYHSGIKTTVVA